MIVSQATQTNRLNGVFHRNGTSKSHAGTPPLDPALDGSAPAATEPSPAPAPQTAGRDPGGRFAAGNKCGKGNPFARRMAAMRSALLESATPERLKAIGEKLCAAALAGDWAAAKLYLAYAVGRPAEAVDPDRLDLDEFRLLDEAPSAAQVLRIMLDALPPALASETAESLTPRNMEGARSRVFRNDGFFKDRDSARAALENQMDAERKARVGRGRRA